jgi:hypothetical protein
MKFRLIANSSKIILFLLLYTFTLNLQGQTGNQLKINSFKGSFDISKQSLTDRQAEYIRKSYSARVEAPKEMINGKEYISYYTRSQSKPLLFVDKKRTASVFTLSRKYNNLILQYDTFLDELIYTDTSRTLNYRFPEIALNKDIVQGFSLYFENDSLLFTYFRQPGCTKMNLKEGFYEIAYKGKSNYIIRHTSSYYFKEGRNEYKYSPENYISSGDVFYRIRSRADLLKLFGVKSGEVKKFLHSNRIKIRQSGKSEFISIVKFYDSLITSSGI